MREKLIKAIGYGQRKPAGPRPTATPAPVAATRPIGKAPQARGVSAEDVEALIEPKAKAPNWLGSF